jgi:hypothetical protein
VIALICLAFVCLWAIALSLLSAVRARAIGEIAIKSIGQKTNSGWEFGAQNQIFPEIEFQAREPVFLNLFFSDMEETWIYAQKDKEYKQRGNNRILRDRYPPISLISQINRLEQLNL